MLGGNEAYIFGISNFTIGSTAISYKVQKYTSTTDNLTVKIGNTTIATRNNVTGDAVSELTKTITFSAAELTKIYNAMPKVTKATFTFIIESFIDGTSIGSTSTTATGTLPNTIVPNLTKVNLTESISDIATKFGGYVKGKSKINYSFSVTKATGTTISSYSLVLDGITYTSSSGTTGALKNSGTLSYSAYVIDSRGRKSNTLTGTISVLDYTSPQITSFKVVRCDDEGNETNEGLHAKYTIDASISPVNNKNDKSFMILYKLGNSSDWYVWRIVNDTYTLSETQGTITIGEDECKFRAMAIDYFNPEENPINKYYDLSSSFMFFETTENLDGIAWGKTAEESGVFDIGFNRTYLSNLTYVGGDERNNNEKNIFFQTTEDATNPSNCKLYGGSGTSDVGIGMYDVGNSRAIQRYVPKQNLLLLEAETLKHKTYLIEALMTKVFTSTIGRIHYENGLLIQWGSTSITPVANTPTSVEITFPISYTSTPGIMTSGLTSVPGTMVLGEGHNNDSATGTTLWVTRTNTTATVVRWLAIGFKEV